MTPALILLGAAVAAPPAYLDAPTATEWLTDHPAWSACDLGAADLLLEVRATVGRDGVVSEAEVVGAPDALAACLLAGLAAHPLPPQPDPAQPLSFTLPVIAGAPAAPQQVSVAARAAPPFLLRPHPDWTEAQRAAAEAALWPGRGAALPDENPLPSDAPSPDEAAGEGAPPAEVYTR